MLTAFVDGVVAAYRDAHAAPGYTVAVVRPDRGGLTKGYGLSDIENATPVDPAATRFHVASISKTFVWTAAMLLVDRGELDLDRDVNDYLTRYTVPEGNRALTVNDLMTHSAGLEESFRVWMPSNASLPLPEAMAATEPYQYFDRGENAAYSNWGSNLVALVIEDITGGTYEDFLYSEILVPLGMTTTVLNEASPNADDSSMPISKNYRVSGGDPEEVEQIDLGAFAPIAGMTTTAVDMARWMRFHLNRGELDGVRLMSEATYAQMRSATFDRVPGSGVRAHGFADVPYRTVRYYGHSGSINEFLSNLVLAPELDLGVFISQNAADSFDPLQGVPTRVMDRALLAQGAPDYLLRPAPTEEDREIAKGIAGSYLSTRRSFVGLEKITTVFFGSFDVTANDGYLTVGSSEAPFVRIGEGLWENRNGARLGVVRDDAGNVVRLIGPSGATDSLPVTFWTNPSMLLVSVVAVVLFTLTTWLGFWRRVRHVRETTTSGRRLSWLALAGIAPLIVFGLVASQLTAVADMGFAEFATTWPAPLLYQLAYAATLLLVFGVVMVVCVLPAWRSSAWSTWRRLHFTAYAAAYGFLGVMLVNWGIAPYIPGLTT
ncbi:MAG: serine hydrolase domain-containing protein [Pseudomonadota bacterium]